MNSLYVQTNMQIQSESVQIFLFYIIRFLLNIYLFQVARVAWNGSYSHDIKTLNGVHQGAVLSPVLFCIYFDELIHALIQGLGSLLVASMGYMVMTNEHLMYVMFVFPELLLVLLAACLLMGRYSGYRLSELYRFKEMKKIAR